ncbi:ABC transporter substrate-binding protein [Blastococcus sp. SYSU D00820]
MRIAVPDLVSPSYFPAIAAVELGYARDLGLDADLELRFPVTDAVAALAEGDIHFLAGAAHAPGHLPDGWDRIALLGALSQHMYWFLVVRSDLDVARGDLAALRDVRIGAAPGPDLGLVEMLRAAGVDPSAAGLEIMPVRGADAGSVSFGVTAAKALEAGTIDAFWANGMGAEVAVQQGVGRLVVDARRGDGPPGSQDYTFAALMTTRRLLEEDRATAAAMTQAVRRAQTALAADPGLATEVGERVFPPMEAALIAELIRRDAPFYTPDIPDRARQGLSAFVTARGLTPIGSRDVTVALEDAS